MGIPYLPPSNGRPLKTSPLPVCVWIPCRCCMIPESNVVQIKPRRLSEREAADYLGPVTPRTLQDWRIKGMGPAYTKLGGRVAYDGADLDSLIARRRVEPQAERACTTPPISKRWDAVHDWRPSIGRQGPASFHRHQRHHASGGESAPS